MPIKVTSCKVAFRKSNVPDGCVRPIWMIEPPGLTNFIADCLVASIPTVSKIISKEFWFISLLLGFIQFELKLFLQTWSLLVLGSDSNISLHFLTFSKINAQSKPIAPPPITKTLHWSKGFFKVEIPSSTAWRDTAVGSAIGASFISSPFGNS